jgi:hypothetical protein
LIGISAANQDILTEVFMHFLKAHRQLPGQRPDSTMMASYQIVLNSLFNSHPTIRYMVPVLQTLFNNRRKKRKETFLTT